MHGKVLLVFFALTACTSAASVSGGASLDPTQASAGGQIRFPLIPGFNSPIFGIPGFLSFFDNSNGAGSQYGTGTREIGSSSGSSSSSASTGTNNQPFGPFTPFLKSMPGLNLLMPQASQIPQFPNIQDLVSKIPGINNRNGNSNISIPPIDLPTLRSGPYIPGISEAMGEAQNHLRAALNISSEVNDGLQSAVENALRSHHPVSGVETIINTIARVYSTAAHSCPIFVIGARLLGEGIRLASEVCRAISNVVIGCETTTSTTAGSTSSSTTTTSSTTTSTTTTSSTTPTP